MLNLIPKPVSIVFNPGEFILSDSITLQATPDLQLLSDYLSGQLEHFTGLKLNLSASGQEKLEYLERANLFVISLDNERRWYRYHQVFA